MTTLPHKKHSRRPRRTHHDARPYIRDIWNFADTPVHTATAGIGMVSLALVLGFIIGLAVFAVMNLSIWLTEAIWNGAETTPRVPWFSLVVCTLGGLVIGIWTHLSHDKVHELEEVMHEFKTTGSFHLESPGKAVISFLLPLVFGGSVGFEAGLTGLITAGCCWIRDRLKALGLAQADIVDSLSFGTIGKPVVAGFIIGLLAMAFPLVLFPGESQAHELMGTWQSWTAAALLATGLLKAAATPLCIRFGWIGGIFFPCIFAGVACGYGLAALTGADPMLLVTITTSGFLAGATRKPLMSVAILVLCFPLTGILWSALAALIVGALPLPRILQKKEGHDHD